jgi:hypothetical protein
MRRYQRGVIVAFLGIVFTTLVKIVGENSPRESTGGWVKLSPPDFKS